MDVRFVIADALGNKVIYLYGDFLLQEMTQAPATASCKAVRPIPSLSSVTSRSGGARKPASSTI